MADRLKINVILQGYELPYKSRSGMAILFTDEKDAYEWL
jgi:hypothetical protein